MTEETSTVVLRPFNPKTDEPLIYATWRNGLWYGGKRDRALSAEFYANTTKKILDLIHDKRTQIRIACLSNDPDQMIGYSFMRGTHIIWLYVKIDFRKQGVGKLLTKGFESVSPVETKVGKAIVEQKKLVVQEN